MKRWMMTSFAPAVLLAAALPGLQAETCQSIQCGPRTAKAGQSVTVGQSGSCMQYYWQYCGRSGNTAAARTTAPAANAPYIPAPSPLTMPNAGQPAPSPTDSEPIPEEQAPQSLPDIQTITKRIVTEWGGIDPNFDATSNSPGVSTGNPAVPGGGSAPVAASTSNVPPPDGNAPPCRWGDQESAVVDFGCLGLDLDQPITLDPHIARGQDRVFPAQMNPAVFENDNYKCGFAALLRPNGTSVDAQEAVTCFKKAALQLPNDPLVRNGMYLAQDILKIRQQKEQDPVTQAEGLFHLSVANAMDGDVPAALYVIQQARKLDPGDPAIAQWQRVESRLVKEFPPENRSAARFVGNALVFESLGARNAEIRTLKLTADLYPQNAYVKVLLARAQILPDTDATRSPIAP